MKGQYKLKVQYLKRAIGLSDNQYCVDGEPKYIPMSAIVPPDSRLYDRSTFIKLTDINADQYTIDIESIHHLEQLIRTS